MTKSLTTIYLITGFALIFSASSCNKFLDKKPSNIIVTPTSIPDLQALLDDADRTMNLGLSPAVGEASADDYFMPDNLVPTISEWARHVYIRKPYDYRFPNEWAQAYIPIYNANYCLEMLEKKRQSEVNTPEWMNVYGSALFFRAYYFLQLIWVYAKAYDEATSQTDPGIALRLTSDFNVTSKRASVKVSYERIIQDAMQSADYLPVHPEHLFRPSKISAYALLARTYLSMRKYDSAYKYANLSLQIKNELMDFNGDTEVSSLNGNFPFKRFNKETIFYTEMNTGGAYGLIFSLRSKIDTTLYTKYDDNDLRKSGFFTMTAGYPNFKGSYSQNVTPFTGLATNEIYLIRAECSARKGIEGMLEGTADLNKLLEHRYSNVSFIPLKFENAKQLLDRIIDERRKELVYRGIRWIDIKRLNKEGAGIMLSRKVNDEIYYVQPNDNYFAFPLPADVIDLTGMEQNKY